jgi:ribosomal protein L11 methyltransferase
MFELSILVPEDAVETVCDALLALDALSVSVEDALADTEQEQARFGEPGMPIEGVAWNQSRIKALFPTEAAAAEAQRLLLPQDFFADCQLESLAVVPDQDWVRLTQSQFDPVAITDSFWVVPTWHEVPAQARHHIRLDPGLAFGTGTHPTTRMCLEWICEQSQPAQRAVDYGCGSGILAIAASKMGVVQVDAVDIDPAAVASTQANAAANHVNLHAVGLPDQAQGTYGWVIANILASPLKVLAPLLCQLMAPGGQMILAGILSRQVEEIQHAYSPWVQLSVAQSRDGWVLMTATRPA